MIRMVRRNNSITLLLAVVLIFGTFNFILPIDICRAATTLHVYSGESLQNAIDGANESDTIIVHSGTYSNIEIDKALTLSADGGNVVISSSTQHTVKITANNVQISGFEIRNQDPNKQLFCVYLSFVSSCQISSNEIKNNDGGYGVYLQFSDSNTVNNNIIEDCNVGIYLSSSDSNTIYSNTIRDNKANGVFIPSTSNGNTFYLNDFDDNVQSNARDEGTNNWDDGTKGNYWDDYNDYDSNGDGIGDSAYSISGSGGNQDTKPKGDFLTENSKPIATITSPSGSVTIDYGESLYFSGTGLDSDPGDSITAYKWTSNEDGQLSTQQSFTTSSLSAGTHTISFYVYDGTDWSDPKTLEVTVEQQVQTNQIPTAYIFLPGSSTAKYYGENIEFRGQGSDSDGQVVEYQWRSNLDGVLHTSRQFTKNDLSIGTHTIYFKVRDEMGDWSSEVTVTVTISPNPTINNPPVADSGGPYSGYTDQSISFDGSSSYDPDSGDNIVSYEWDFGDGTTGSGSSVEHTYSTEGKYTIELTVADSEGEESTSSTECNVTIDNSNQNNGDNNNEKDKGLPGFELIIVLIAIALIIFYKRRV